VDSPEELAALREQEDLPFEVLSDPDKSLISEWDIVNEKERGGIAFPNTYVINQDREVVCHSRDTTASRVKCDPLIEFLQNYDQNASHRQELEDHDKSFQWPSLSSMIWGLPRKFGCMKS
jgi:alkyl hydroperoxide reductase subunit AhpC